MDEEIYLTLVDCDENGTIDESTRCKCAPGLYMSNNRQLGNIMDFQYFMNQTLVFHSISGIHLLNYSNESEIKHYSECLSGNLGPIHCLIADESILDNKIILGISTSLHIYKINIGEEGFSTLLIYDLEILPLIPNNILRLRAFDNLLLVLTCHVQNPADLNFLLVKILRDGETKRLYLEEACDHLVASGENPSQSWKCLLNPKRLINTNAVDGLLSIDHSGQIILSTICMYNRVKYFWTLLRWIGLWGFLVHLWFVKE